MCLFLTLSSFEFNETVFNYCKNRNIALRKAEKEEEKKAREKVMMKVNADKVIIFHLFFLSRSIIEN